MQMRKWLPTSRAGLALLFLFLGLGVLVNARRTYLHYAERPIETLRLGSGAGAQTAVQATIKELKSKLEKSKVGAGRYAVAAEKNLFSPDRRAWQPPTPEAPAGKTEEVKEAKPAPTRRDVILYGTYIAGGRKKAVLRFTRLGRKSWRLAEGEEARDENRPNGLVYTLVKVEARKVTIKDSRNRQFEVGLYDNKRRRPIKTVAAAQPKITVEQAKAPMPTAAPAARAGTSPAARGISSAAIRKLPAAKKDALVEQGVLKKFSTPFGPVYRRVKK